MKQLSRIWHALWLPSACTNDCDCGRRCTCSPSRVYRILSLPDWAWDVLIVVWAIIVIHLVLGALL